jgi:ribosomal protein S18 acetylase RimI-like enzyme
MSNDGRPAPQLTARPLRTEEYAAWYRHVTDGYAHDIEVHAGTDPEVARRKAERDMRSVLPGGLETPDHAVFVLESGGERIGLLWVGTREVDERRILYVWDVEIDEAQRGRGFGRQAMLVAEELARSRGLDRIELNVFGGNAVARGLYGSLGYVERAVSMAKDLSDPDESR